MERYHLADIVMRADRDPVSKDEQHAYFSREGSRGGREWVVEVAGVINHEEAPTYPFA